jgi:hypothetical protein
MAERSRRVLETTEKERPHPVSASDRAERRTAALRVIAANCPGEETWNRESRGRRFYGVAVAVLLLVGALLVAWYAHRNADRIRIRPWRASPAASPAPFYHFPAVDVAMGRLSPSYNSLRRAVRTPSALDKADRVELAADVSRLITVAKVLRAETDPADQLGLPQQQWTAAVERFRAAALDLSREIQDPDATHARVRKSFIRIQASCTGCHTVFRP